MAFPNALPIEIIFTSLAQLFHFPLSMLYLCKLMKVRGRCRGSVSEEGSLQRGAVVGQDIRMDSWKMFKAVT